MISRPTQESFPKLADVDRHLALAFGVLILLLMIIVLLAGGFYVRGSIEREQTRLSAMTTQVLASAVSRISFSGKYHSRLMLEEIKAAQPGILYLRLVDVNGVILADSDPLKNDQEIETTLLSMIRPVFDGRSPRLVRHFQLDGVPVREVSIAYRGGYDNAVVSVLQLGVSEHEHKRDLDRGIYFVALVVLGLLLLGILATWRISAYFGKPVRQLLNTLEHERAQLRTLVSTLPDLVWVKNGEGVYLACNRRFEEFFGAREQDIVGKTDFDFVELNLAESFRKHDLAAMESDAPSINEEEIVFASDGHRELLETTKTAMHDHQGKLIGILGIGHDISERKRTELALQASRSLLQTALDTIPARVFWKDTECRYLGCNQAFARDAGFASPTALVGLTDFEIGGPERVRDCRDDDRNSILFGQAKVDHEELRMGPKGESVWLQTSSVPLRDTNGTVFGVLGTYFDITERKQSEAELDRHRLHLEELVEERTVKLRVAMEQLAHAEKLAALGSLVAGVAHELNTPIGNAVMVASTLNDGHRNFSEAMQGPLKRSTLTEFSGMVGESCQILMRNLERAAHLVSSFKQVAVDQSSYQRRRFDLREIVDEISLALAPSLRHSSAKLNLEVPEGIILDSYPGPLGQVLMNLINNAMVHGYGAELSGPITVDAKPLDGGVFELSVSDQGKGIPAAHISRVFDPFFTTRLGQGGSGLGLNIVYNLVTELLNGSIEVTSEVGTGTTFRMCLPYSPSRPQDVRGNQSWSE